MSNYIKQACSTNHRKYGNSISAKPYTVLGNGDTVLGKTLSKFGIWGVGTPFKRASFFFGDTIQLD
jgi:hypothetical protein